jgi:HTH-type transcriptional regulator / antitoxin HipB
VYPIDTPHQLRIILRALRIARSLTQEELGSRVGVSQKRIARIEAAPELASYDQIARMVNALEGRLWLAESPHRVTEAPPFAEGADAW